LLNDINRRILFSAEEIRIMSVNLNPILKDPDVIPSEEIIVSLVGERIKLWQAVLNYASENNKDVSGDWHYYKDGKQWLYKLINKKKTIFWAVVADDTFRITFYFGDKALSLIEESDIPVRIIDEFKNAKKIGSIRGISVILNGNEDVENVSRLINIKSRLK
jgi:hypothetical protein